MKSVHPAFAQASDRANVDDPAAAAADQGQEGLDDGEMADQVDLELPTEIFQRLELERPGRDDAGRPTVHPARSRMSPCVAARGEIDRAPARTSDGHLCHSITRSGAEPEGCRRRGGARMRLGDG